MTWTPFGANAEDHVALVDGTPDWMLSSLRAQFKEEFTHSVRSNGYQGGYRTVKSVGRMRDFDLASRGRPFADMLQHYDPDVVFNSMTEDERLRAFDWVIRDNVALDRASRNEDIEAILFAGGSQWKVGLRDGVPGLEDRVPQGVQDAADAVMMTPGDAGKLLSDAWHSAFGVRPDSETAYAKAIKAVEAAAVPVVSPNNASATLGTVIAQMRSQSDWKLELTREHSTHPPGHVLVGMMQMLWTGQNDRHAGQPGYQPSTPAEAEAAVLLAVPLVQWFTSGAIQRRP